MKRNARAHCSNPPIVDDGNHNAVVAVVAAVLEDVVASTFLVAAYADSVEIDSNRLSTHSNILFAAPRGEDFHENLG